MIGVASFNLARAEAVLVDHAADQDDVGPVDDPAETVDETEFLGFIAELERAGFLAGFALVQDYDVVAEVVELELLERGDNFLAVVLLVEDAKCQHEQRVVGIHGLHAVIPALIDIDDEVTKAPGGRGRALAVLDERVEIEIEQGKLLVGSRHDLVMPVCSALAKPKTGFAHTTTLPAESLALAKESCRKGKASIN